MKAGDPLFEIEPDPTPLEVTEVDRAVESAPASFDRAKVDYDRAQELFRQGITPKSDVDEKREAFELAKVALTKAEQDRDLTRKGRLRRRPRPGSSRSSARRRPGRSSPAP